MPFITQGKTNWKFLSIVIILAIIVGGGTLWYSVKKEPSYQPPGLEKPTKETIILEGKIMKEDYVSAIAWSLETDNKERYLIVGEKSGELIDKGEGIKVKITGYLTSTTITIPTAGEFERETRKAIEIVDYEITDETADWKTYTNTQYGFEIKYPSDVSVQDDGYIDYLNGVRISFCGGEYAEFCGIKGASSHSEIYLFKFEKNGVEKDLYLFIFAGGSFPVDSWPFGEDPNKNCKSILLTVDGQPGKMWNCGDNALYAFWERAKDNSFYYMNVDFLDDFHKLTDTFNQMLSTFRFLK